VDDFLDQSLGIRLSCRDLITSDSTQAAVRCIYEVIFAKVHEGAKAGEKVFFEGYEGTTEPQLNPKKQVFEPTQPGFKITEDQMVAFDGDLAGWTGEAEKGKAKGAAVAKLVTASGGVCKAPTLKEAVIS
jgi:hypothetical protein